MIFGLPDYINLFLRNDNMFGYDLGIDFGTSSLVISVPGKGVVVNEPSYVAYDTETEKMLYAGRRAYYLEGREPSGISVIQPIAGGHHELFNCRADGALFYKQNNQKKHF